MVGARVNGKLVPIETELHNGDRVEIITSQNSKGPSRDWLKVVKSTQAKNRINQWFRQELKEDNIIKGKEMLSSYAKLKGKNLGLYLKPHYMDSVKTSMVSGTGIPYWRLWGTEASRRGQVLNKLMEAFDKEHKRELTDKEVLEAAKETKAEIPVNKSKGGSRSTASTMWRCAFPNAAAPFPETRSWALSPEAGGSPSTGPTA